MPVKWSLKRHVIVFKSKPDKNYIHFADIIAEVLPCLLENISSNLKHSSVCPWSRGIRHNMMCFSPGSYQQSPASNIGIVSKVPYFLDILLTKHTLTAT